MFPFLLFCFFFSLGILRCWASCLLLRAFAWLSSCERCRVGSHRSQLSTQIPGSALGKTEVSLEVGLAVVVLVVSFFFCFFLGGEGGLLGATITQCFEKGTPTEDDFFQQV